MLKEHFGTSIKAEFPTKERLMRMLESSNQAVIQIRNTGKKFHLDPEYAKFLGLRDVIDTMLSEGMYISSPAHKEMSDMLRNSCRKLIDSGYTDDEARAQCMNAYRQDPRWAFDDSYVQPLVDQYINEYKEECTMAEAPAMPELPVADPIVTPTSQETFMQQGQRGPGKLEDSIHEAISRARSADDLNVIKRKAMKAFENMKAVGRAHPGRWRAVLEAFRDRESELLDGREAVSLSGFAKRMSKHLSEASDVDQAEVIMAVRALADDIQDQVERLGRMMNEDLPAIVDQMRSESGAQAASGFNEALNGALSAHLEATKQLKTQFDTAISAVTGDASPETALAGPGGPGPDMGGDPLAGGDMGDDEGEPSMPPPSKGKSAPPLGRPKV